MDAHGRLVSGEAVELDVRVAGVGSRVLALMIDLLVQAVLATMLVLAGLAAAGRVLGAAADAAFMQGLAVVVSVAVLVGYPVGLMAASGGRTVGKLALGLRVVRDEAGPIRFRHALTRTLVGVTLDFPGFVLPGLTWTVSLVTMLATPRAKRLATWPPAPW
jgi:uncharacterized RDD family membrane protein YckC